MDDFFDTAEFFDEKGLPAVLVPLSTLNALAPLTRAPDLVLERLGLSEPLLKSALAEIATIVAKKS